MAKDSVASLDRKLHKIVLAASNADFDTASKLAKHLADQQLDEFSYSRDNQINYTRPASIRSYVTFARDIELLTPELDCAIDKSRVRNIEPFRSWAGDKVMRFNSSLDITPARLEAAVKELIHSKNTLPTSQRLYNELGISGEDISVQSFGRLLTLQAILRPATLKLHRQWLWLPENTLKA